MKVFVSWSGSLSHAVAEAFAAWLPTVIQECRAPFVSSDLAKGEAWFQAISEELVDSGMGVAFITAENSSSPWLHFESGAMLTTLSKQRICPVVVDIAKADYDGPMKNLQLTELADKSDFSKLLVTINAACDNPLDAFVLKETFDLRWPLFELQFQEAQVTNVPEVAEQPRTHRTSEEKIDEVLGLVREMRTSPIYRRETSAEEQSTIATLNASLLERREGWDAARVAAYIRDYGDVVTEKATGRGLGTLVDVQPTAAGTLWARIESSTEGKLLAIPLDQVSVAPF